MIPQSVVFQLNGRSDIPVAQRVFHNHMDSRPIIGKH